MAELIRRIEKISNVSGQVPTIPPSSDHSDGTWNATDIYDGELFFNSADNILFTRFGSDIVRIGPSELKAFRNTYNLSSGLNVITHNLGVLPATITFWKNGASIGINAKTRTTTQITVEVSAPLSGVEVCITAF